MILHCNYVWCTCLDRAQHGMYFINGRHSFRVASSPGPLSQLLYSVTHKSWERGPEDEATFMVVSKLVATHNYFHKLIDLITKKVNPQRSGRLRVLLIKKNVAEFSIEMHCARAFLWKWVELHSLGFALLYIKFTSSSDNPIPKQTSFPRYTIMIVLTGAVVVGRHGT